MDISDKEWKLVEPSLPGAARSRHPPKTELRHVINALRYLVRSGCEWRMLPNDFPPYQTVYYWFRRLMRRFLFRTIHDLALMLDRMASSAKSFHRPVSSTVSRSRHRVRVNAAMTCTKRSAGANDTSLSILTVDF